MLEFEHCASTKAYYTMFSYAQQEDRIAVLCRLANESVNHTD